MEGVWQELREVEVESKARRKRSHEHEHVDEMKNSLLEPRCVCARCDVLTPQEDGTVRAHAQTLWKSVKVVLSSLVFASCSVTT